jgi:uncharacterized protein YndB with AHSA1/START domain
VTAKSETKVRLVGATKAQKEFTISRVVNAPLERVWRAWTDAKQLKHWWGPKGFEVVSTKVDLRAGGVFHYHLRSPGGQDMWGKFIYREIVPQKRLVFVVSFSDQAGGVTRHPLHEKWPLTIFSTVCFAEANGKTRDGNLDPAGRDRERAEDIRRGPRVDEGRLERDL